MNSDLLGLRALGELIDLLDQVTTDAAGIHLVVTDCPATVELELRRRCPERREMGPLFKDDGTGLAPRVYHPPAPPDGRLLVARLDPREPGARDLVRALNVEREWLLAPGNHAIVLITGADPRDAGDAYLALQAAAPDFWSLRSRVYEIHGGDDRRRVTELLLDRVAEHFVNRAAAARWLDTRDLDSDWIIHRLWHAERPLDQWLGDAIAPAPALVAHLEASSAGRSAPLDITPLGEPATAKWPRPQFPSGQLTAVENQLAEAAEASLDRDRRAALYLGAHADDAARLLRVALTVALLRAGRSTVVHLDGTTDLGASIGDTLTAAGVVDAPRDLIGALRRLAGALSGRDALLVVTNVQRDELRWLEAIVAGHRIIASIRARQDASIAVCHTSDQAPAARWLHTQLAGWPLGTIVLGAEPATLVLTLREGLARAQLAYVLADAAHLPAPVDQHFAPADAARLVLVSLDPAASAGDGYDVLQLPATPGEAAIRLREETRARLGEPVGAAAVHPIHGFPRALAARSLDRSALLSAAAAIKAGDEAALTSALAQTASELLGRLPSEGQSPGDGVAALVGRRSADLLHAGQADDGPAQTEETLLARIGQHVAITVAQLLAGLVAEATRPDPALLDALGGLNAGFDALRAEMRTAAPRVHVDVQHVHPGAIGVAVGRAAVEEVTARTPAIRVPATADETLRLRRLLWDNDRSNVGEDSPANRLIAGVRRVPFDDTLHARELSRLATWCHEPTDSSIRVLYGPGGAGKTRLAIELADRLRAAGWHAGFLRERATDLDPLAAGEHPRLVIVDYAEGRPDQLSSLLDLGAQLHAVPGPKLRILLLARHAEADWWRQQHTSGPGDVQIYLAECGGALLLPQLADDLALRTRQFRAAVTAFAGGRDPTAVSVPDLRADPFGRPLYIHLAAAAALDGATLSTARALLDHTLDREQRAWRKRWPGPLDARGAERLTEATATMLAALTMRGGEPDVRTLEHQISTVAPVERSETDAVVDALRAFYPANAADYTAKGARGLEPELLGEHLVERVLTRDSDLLTRAFLEASDPRIERAFTVLARLGSRLPDDRQAAVADWVRALLAAAPAERFPLAVRAVLGTDGEGATRPGDHRHRFWLDDVLAAVVREGTLDDHLSEMEPLVLQPTVSLRRTAAELSLRAAGEAGLPEEERARRLSNASACLAMIGHREEALAAGEDAASRFRRLAAADPAAFEPDLAASLTNMSTRLAAVGHLEEALAVSLEAAETYRRLAADRPDTFEPYLATALNNLSANLARLGRDDEALAAVEDAVAIRRRLACARPGTFGHHLASSLVNLSNVLALRGHAEEALAAIQEATNVQRHRATTRPEAFGPDLADSLSSLAVRLADLGFREDALAAAREGANMYRSLAAGRPDAFEPRLANALDILSSRLAELGDQVQAAAAIQEAADIRRRLAAVNPAAFEPQLAISLTNLSIQLSAVGRHPEALVAAQGAVDVHRRLAAAHPDAFEPDLGKSLNSLSNRLAALGRHDAALDAASEAVGIYRRLTAVRPQAFDPSLALSLNTLANRLAAVGRREDACDAAQEATELYRRLATARPTAYEPALATSISNLANQLATQGRSDDALAAALEAVSIRRRLVAAQPRAFEPDLATSLNNLSVLLAAAGRRDEALTAAADSVQHLTPHFLRNPLGWGSRIQTFVSVYVQRCQEAGVEPSTTLLQPIDETFARLRSGVDQPPAEEPEA